MFRHTVFSFGESARNIADRLAKIVPGYYEIFSLDTSPPASIILPVAGHRAYSESQAVDYAALDGLPENISTQEITAMLSAVSEVSGASLPVLGLYDEQRGEIDISVLYNRTDYASSKDKRESLVFGVLQEYARSAALNELIVFDNDELKKIIGKYSFKDYYTKINDVVSYYYHLYNVAKHTEPVFVKKSSSLESGRIKTFSVLDLNAGTEKAWYRLHSLKQIDYYLFLTEETMSDESLQNKIQNIIETRTKDGILSSFRVYEGNADVAFGVHSTNQVLFE